MKKSNRSAWYGSTSRAAVIVGLGLALGLLPKAVHAAGCTGDCNVNETVAQDELLKMVDVALDDAAASACADGFASTDGKITVNEILTAVNTAATNSGVCGGTPPAVCGDGVPNGDEECDNGGSCLGGMDAGKACTAEADCRGDGVCLGGTKVSTPCSSSAECPGSTCQKCVPQGGDTCAANCTTETDVPFTLKPGVVDEVTQNITAGTSGAVVHGNLQIPLPLTGNQIFTVGKLKNGIIPVVVKASSVVFPKIDVMGLACACVRGVAARTCGGTAFAKTGGAATDCAPGFATDTHDDGACPAELPCAFVHGAGNSASGVLSCVAGLEGVNIEVTQDDANAGVNNGTCTTDAQCVGLPGNSTCVADPDTAGHKFCSAGPSTLTLSGTGLVGAGILINSTAIGQKIGSCAAAPTFCTSIDPFTDVKADRGSVATIPIVTGTASGQFTTANGIPDNTVCQCTDSDFLTCSLNDCANPWMVSGALVNCAALAMTPPNVSGASLATSFTSAHIPIVGDSVVTTVFFAQ